MSSPILSKKLSSSRIVWFEPSNQWVYLEEPAWFVFQQLRNKKAIAEIARKCAGKYRVSYGECLRFVEDISASLAEFQKPLLTVYEESFTTETASSLSFTSFSTRHYSINKKIISICFDSRLSEYYIHPPFAHLEITPSGKADVCFEVFSHKGQNILRWEGQTDTTYVSDDFNRLKRNLFIQISNIVYKRTHNHWLSFVHASGITDGRQTILLSSSSGSGKSTMAALLQAKGFQMVSDDFVPLDARNKKAFPFPAAISVKEGAFSVLSAFYKNLHDPGYNLYPYTNKSVRYLHPLSSVSTDYKPRPVKTMIFIKYNPEIACQLIPLSIPEALKLYHEQAWVSHNPSYARTFINWFVKLECFRLEYSDIKKGMEAVTDRFRE